ncbi:uncharacterized protein LOC132656501 [Meriones unguiculatus]|uniref:uncharacterized protein LOC132656501 n=1 Tax=Meriones unguiculatus TaxID=10047 RepID=UPI00293F28AB|nr:uncharacterized protein LOC132656501 [Meriones unguiculatus]XP_060247394.1 uncharacterized protein LOC132656501 [Meriones unguiculatus]
MAGSGTPHHLRDCDPGGGALCLCSLPPQAVSCLLPTLLVPRTYLPQASRWRSLGLPRRAGASPPAPAWCAAASPPSGKEGREKCAAVALVTGQDAGPGWAPNEEEGDPGGELGGQTLRGVRREEFGAWIWIVAVLRWSGGSGYSLRHSRECPLSGRRAAGTMWPLAQGAGPSRRRLRDGPLRVPGEPSGFPRSLPRPPPQNWRRKGAGELAGATQSFQRHFQGVGSELLSRARTEGRSD